MSLLDKFLPDPNHFLGAITILLGFSFNQAPHHENEEFAIILLLQSDIANKSKTSVLPSIKIQFLYFKFSLHQGISSLNMKRYALV